MIDIKFDELKDVFIAQTKEIVISSIKEEMKTIFAGELVRFKGEVNKKTDEIT